MSPADFTTTSDNPPAEGLAGLGGGNDSGPREVRHHFLWAWGLGAALLAGLASWAIGERTLDYFEPSPGAAKNLFDPGPLRKELAVIVPKNTAIAFGTLGGLLGLMTGLVGGIARRSALPALVAAALGAGLGVTAGSALSFALVPVFLKTFDPTHPSLLQMVVLRGAIWTGIGGAAGLALGIGLRDLRRTVHAGAGGLLGGAMGTVVFEVVNALISPLDRNDQIIPTTVSSRLLASLTVAACIALGACLAARGTTPRPTNSPVAE